MSEATTAATEATEHVIGHTFDRDQQARIKFIVKAHSPDADRRRMVDIGVRDAQAIYVSAVNVREDWVEWCKGVATGVIMYGRMDR